MNFHFARITGVGAVLTFGWMASIPNVTHAEPNVVRTAGTLTCITEGGTSHLQLNGVDMRCTFNPTSLEQQSVHFRGKVNQAKAKPLGPTKTLIVWQVLSSANSLTARDIEGSYEALPVERASPDQSVGLIQRSEQDVILQPLTRGVRANDDNAFNVIEIQLVRSPMSA